MASWPGYCWQWSATRFFAFGLQHIAQNQAFIPFSIAA
jgi:hypothetical protein